MNEKLITHLTVIISIGWTLLLGLIITFNIESIHNEVEKLALAEAKANVKKDLAFRSWVASHGGVYVPIDEHTKPNPYLLHVKNKNVTTDAGQKLTLMNPAYGLSQMMKDYSSLYGIRSKITSHILLNPKNAPDAWEDKALTTIEKTKEPFYSKSLINGREYLRYMDPFVIQKSCLKCHGYQGYAIGDIRGGISVGIPLAEYYTATNEHLVWVIAAFVLIWLIGLLIINIVFRMVQKNIKERLQLHEENVYSLVDIIEQRDAYTAGHSRRVAEYSRKIAEAMNLPKKQVELLYRAAILHDIGKIGTPDAVLLKPNKLTDMEFALIKEHVVKSYEILQKTSVFKDIAEIVRYHHERYDGTGYPMGTTGDKQPFLSSILSLADAFDAMTTDRIYKARMSIEEALEEIQSLSGKQFHPDVALVAKKALGDIQIEASTNQIPSTKLEAQRFAYFYKDQLTGLHNQDYLEFVLTGRGHDIYHYYCACIIYLQHVSSYNSSNGWHSGNLLLKSFASELEKKFPQAIIFRIFGDDFLVLHVEHTDLPCHDEFVSLKDTGITTTTQHFDLHDTSLDIETLKSIVLNEQR